MTIVDVKDFIKETECVYKAERYSVRDNGAVLRHQQIEKRVRPNDNKWTFGKISSSDGYMWSSGVQVHRIVATAFHGEPPDHKYVVDHIDTNRRNNRPENLRWLTRLENALKNPITRKRIEFLCGGSIEAFLENPSILRSLPLEKNYEWMRTVTPEEAKNCLERMSIWAKTNHESKGGSLGEWIFKPIKDNEMLFTSNHEELMALAEKEAKEGKERMRLELNANKQSKRIAYDEPFENNINKIDVANIESEYVMSLTENCVQDNWRVPSFFPCCPVNIGNNPVDEYYKKLKLGAVFTYNDKYPESIIIKFVKTENDASILVMCEKDSIKPWSVAKITYNQGFFIHSNLGSFFDNNGADKTFCIEQGLEWLGGDTFDDFC